MKRTLSIVLVLLLTLAAQAQTRHLRVYQHSGSVDTLTVSAGAAVTHSKTDLQGTVQRDFVTLAVQAVDTTRRYLLADVDSLVLPTGRRVVFRGMAMEQATGAKGGPRHTSINGTFPGTKGQTVQVLWTDNDPIRLDVGYTSRAQQLSADKTSATFTFDADDLDADAYTVYYPDREVTIPAVQTQVGADNSDHFGTCGDCGAATAARGSDGNYSFTLAHQAAYLCFLPHIDHLPSVRVSSIEAKREGNDALAGTYSLSLWGLYNAQNTAKKITLNLTPLEEHDFFLGHQATTEQDSVAAYMVIVPNNSNFAYTVTYHLTDTLTHIITDYVQTINFPAEAGKIYTITCNIPESILDRVDMDGGSYLWATQNAGTTNTQAGAAEAIASLDGGWELPNATDVDNLLNQCTWTTGSYNGQQGWMVTSPTQTNANGNAYRLFIPYGDYWTSTPETADRQAYATLHLTATAHEKVYQSADQQLAVRPIVSSYWYKLPTKNTLTVDATELVQSGRTKLQFCDDGGPNGNYSNDVDGYLRVNAPEGYHMVISGSVDTECGYDKLTITDLKTNTALVNAASGKTTFNVTTTGNQALIYFHSDGGSVRSGFTGTITFVKD